MFIEDIEKYNKDVLEKIELKTSMEIPRGESLKLYNIPIIIKELLKYLKADINKEEVLIICGNKEKSIDLINNLSKIIRFISIVGVDDKVREAIYEEILNSTGISLIQPINIEKTIKNYNIIINLSEKRLINIESIRRKAIIIDFSNSKSLIIGEKSINSNILIEDINLNIVNSGIKYNPWFESRVSSSLYESLMGSEKVEFCQIYSKNKFHFVKDLINKEIKIKGSM